MTQCSVPFCESNTDCNLRDSVTFFNFPDSVQEAELFSKWVIALQEQPEYFAEKEKYICSRHFRDEDFSSSVLNQEWYLDSKTLVKSDIKLVLVKDAVPSLLLPNDEKKFSLLSKNDAVFKLDEDESFFVKVKEERIDEDQYSTDSESSNQMVVAEDVSNDSFSQNDETKEKVKIEVFKEEIFDSKPTSSLPVSNVLIKEELILDETSDHSEEELYYSPTGLKEDSLNTCHTCFNYQSKICTLQKNDSEMEELRTVTINFQNHKLIHCPPLEKKYSCYKCHKKFAWQKELRRHKILHHKSYKCDICRKVVSELASLKSHKRIRHKILETHTCEICEKTFGNSRELWVHRKEHRKTYRCPKCQKKFDSEVEAKVHDCKRLQCKLCKKYFVSESYLNIHMNKFHSKENLEKLKCKSCNKSFQSFKAIKYHTSKYHSLQKTPTNVKEKFVSFT